VKKEITYKKLENMVNKTYFKQITLNNLVSGRFSHNSNGWIKFNIREDLSSHIDAIADIVGGRKKELLKANLHFMINNNLGGCGLFDRMVYSYNKYTKKYNWHYIAGQDFVSEVKTFREIIYKY
jgi:hypothetical protein